MPQLKFSINGTEVGHPLNWRDIKIRYKRDDVVRGLFTTYSSDIIWTGAEYASLVAMYDLLTCDTADLLIESRCGRYDSWTTLLEGKLLLKDSKIDRQKCTITCNAEQSGCQGLLFDNLDTPVDIGFIGTAGVDQWKEVTANFTVCQPLNSNPLCAGYVPNAPVAGSYGKSISTIFTQLLDSITDGCLGFISDWFSQVHDDDIWTLQCTVAMNAGDVFRIEWDDEFGNTHEVEVISTGVIATDIANIGTAVVFKDYALYPYFSTRNRKGEAAFVTYPAADTAEITWHFLPQNLTISYPSGTFVFTNTQAGNVGGAENYSVVPSFFDATGNYTVSTVAGVNWAQLASGAYMLNFKDFFEVCDKLWNLGMQIEPDGGGGWRVRIEPIDYFYSAVPSVTLRDIPDVERTSENDLFATFWHFGKETDQTYTTYQDFNPDLSTPPASTSGITSCFSEWWVQSGEVCTPVYDRRYKQKEFVLGLGLTYQDDILDGLIQNDNYSYIICVNHFGVALPDTARFYKYETYGYYVGPAPFPYDQYFYDVKTQPEMVYINHRNIMPEHFNYELTFTTTYDPGVPPPQYIQTQAGGYATISEGAYWLPYRWKFKRYITDDQWATIVNSQVITVNEGSDPVNDVNGYIREITYRISDGSTDFLLETKS